MSVLDLQGFKPEHQGRGSGGGGGHGGGGGCGGGSNLSLLCSTRCGSTLSILC